VKGKKESKGKPGYSQNCVVRNQHKKKATSQTNRFQIINLNLTAAEFCVREALPCELWSISKAASPNSLPSPTLTAEPNTNT